MTGAGVLTAARTFATSAQAYMRRACCAPSSATAQRAASSASRGRPARFRHSHRSA